MSRVVLIGASSGGVPALLDIARRLPPGFAASVCIVQHVGSHPSILPDLLGNQGPNAAVHASDGQRVVPGTLYVAPPDHHMLLEGDTVRLTRGPKENYARPAIDPLFRSAASSLGSRAIGVILTGQMDDGTVGLQAIQAAGGITLVQDPATAAYPEMPESALRHVQVDHCVPLDQIAGVLADLVGRAAPAARALPKLVEREVQINRGGNDVEHLVGVAAPSSLTCPECGGSLWEMKGSHPLRYRCHTGHAFTGMVLARAQADTAEEALWAAIRALQEEQLLLHRLADVAQVGGDHSQASAARSEADALTARIQQLKGIAQLPPTDTGRTAAAGEGAET
jgi:two-component system chemotaxis response regulator CheB